MAHGSTPNVVPDEFQSEIDRNFRWNFGINATEGMLWWFGSSFFAPSVIMPLYVKHLTSNQMLIGLVAAIAGAGWYIPQLFTASYTERLPKKKTLVVNVGLFTERLPILLMSLSALVFGARQPRLALLLFFTTLLWHTLGTGVIAIAWQEMIARIIPVNYRGRMLGISVFGGTVLGVIGATLAARILAAYPFPYNFALCFGMAFALIMGSWLLIAQTREPPMAGTKPVVPLITYWRSLPKLLRRDRNFTAYLLSRLLAALSKIGLGFVVVYAVERWHLTDSQAGLYSTTMLAGQALSNLLLGMLADRRGHKVVLQIAQGLGLLSMVAVLLVPSPIWMFVVFGALGVVGTADLLSGIAIVMELAEPDNRAAYFGLANTVPGLFAAMAPLLGGWIAATGGYTLLFATAAAFSVFAWAALTWLVQEPRRCNSG